jgi:hypothetical protein
MNERIKELMVEAGYAAPELAGRGKKLAELIVKECISIIETDLDKNESLVKDDIGRAWVNSQKTYAEVMKGRFGLKESKGWVCPKCGIDRGKEACPNGYHAALTGQCPMIGVAQ